jgi:cysteine-rich repeat protein
VNLRPLLIAAALIGCQPFSSEPDNVDPIAALPVDQAAPPVPFNLAITPLVTGAPFTLTASGIPSGFRVTFLASGNVTAPGICPPPIAPTCTILGGPIITLGTAVADSAGVATLTRTLPTTAPPRIEFQAYGINGGVAGLSNGLQAQSYPAAGDEDSDGLTNGTELGLGTDLLQPDSDADELDDGDEVTAGTDPLNPDSDGDGLSDGEEVYGTSTDPADADSDDDGLNDGDEIEFGTSPLLSDSDVDGLTDFDEVVEFGTDPNDDDTDGGGVTDGQEVINGTDPLDGLDDIGAVCGDGMINAGETCDFALPGFEVLCPATCVLPVEVEPNDGAASANGPFMAPVLIEASVNPGADGDWYMLTVPAHADLVVNTWDAFGPTTCATIDTLVSLYAPDGATLLAIDDDDGELLCSALTPGVDAGVRGVPPGTYYLRVVPFSTTATFDYRVGVTYAALCGDGQVTGSEECDGTPNCDAACQRVPACSDGFTDAPETCDDGNQNSGDGCSATCQLEGLTNEIEPNNSVADADANGLVVSSSGLIAGAITDVSDEKDFFRVQTGGLSVVRFELFDNTAGNDCGSTTGTLRLFDAAGTPIISDAGGGIRSCPAMIFPFAGGVNYLQLEETGTNGNIPLYRLESDFVPFLFAETETNDTTGTAQPLGSTDGWVFGDHSVAADFDFYSFTLTAPASVRLEIIEGDRAVETCESNGIDSRLQLLNSGGSVLVDDDDDGRGYCSLIDGTGTVFSDPNAHNLAAGTYFIRVSGTSTTVTAGNQFVYRLVVLAR